MIVVPGIESVPYHLIYVSLTVAYGLRVWPARKTLAVLLGVSVATGSIIAARVLDGTIHGQEMAEVVLMPAIFLGMIWHAQRHLAAKRQIEILAENERALLDGQREFLRDASHAIRTPLTIARGHVDLIKMGMETDTAREDADIVIRQLDRLARLAARLLVIEELERPDALVADPLDVQSFVADLGHRWATFGSREWMIDARPTGIVWVDQERLETALDAVVENAVKFTHDGDTITLACRSFDHRCQISVSDTGEGIPPQALPHVFDRFWHSTKPGCEPGYGLGLSLVRAVIEAHGGSVVARNRKGGGAVLTLELPREIDTREADTHAR